MYQNSDPPLAKKNSSPHGFSQHLEDYWPEVVLAGNRTKGLHAKALKIQGAGP
jgi:hypothetical protein